MAAAGTLSHELLNWYDRHRRVLPWRALPGERADPYRVWLSEIMLQQTTVTAVAPYFERFLARWPTVEALGMAAQDDVLAEWAGLGYYARARNLHACAKVVAREYGGHFPDHEAGLLALPGIGPYTAGAIAAIAFNRPAVAVDGNVERVISRLRAIETPLPAAKPEIAAEVRAQVPADRPGDFAQALMDLGATICTPKSPKCLLCPWEARCAARARGIAASLPKKLEKKPKPVRRGVAFWLQRADGAVLFRKRAEKGLLGGMWEVPSTPWEAAHLSPGTVKAHAPATLEWERLPGLVRHTFTHFDLELEVWRACGECEGHFATPVQWTRLALPNVMKKVVAHATHGGS